MFLSFRFVFYEIDLLFIVWDNKPLRTLGIRQTGQISIFYFIVIDYEI